MASCAEMADTVQPDPKTVQQQLRRSRSLWSSYAVAATNPRLPADCILLRNILGRVPTFPTSLLLANKKPSTLQYHHPPFGVQISGVSTWSTSQGECNLPPKTIHHKLLCGVHNSIECAFAENSRFTDWPGIEGVDEHSAEGNHLAILLLAWAYILSARWIELQSPSCLREPVPPSGIYYSDLQAVWLNNDEDIPVGTVEIDIGEACERATRWWAAILAPGEGWHATLDLGGKPYRSPWSAHIASAQILKLRKASVRGTTHTSSSVTAPSSEEALDYLREYCERHNIDSQYIPALATSLFLPWKNSDGSPSATIPLPKPTQTPVPRLRQKTSSSSFSLHRTFQDQSRLLPYYMTLSCNIHGLRALLCGSFFDPVISCNLVSPWMQPVFETIDPILAREEFTSLATIMSKRQPNLAALWLGAIILGMEKTVLQPLRIGLVAVELHAAAWTGSIHSFISLRPNTPCVVEKISRSDECRLLFLTGSERHQRVPVCPWQPFGTTPLDLTEIEVQQHATCEGHCLQYNNWCWDTDNGPSSEDRGFDENSGMDRWGATTTGDDAASVTTQTKGVLQTELLSETATRSIFSWLRVDGYSPIEKDIFTHTWFDVGSSSEESTLGDDDSPFAEHGIIDEPS